MKIYVCSRKEIEAAIEVESEYVVISIHDPEKPPAKVKKQSGLREVLSLAFHDAVPAAGLSLEIRPMTPDHAAAICHFVRHHQSHITAIVIHCESGFSRSPAIAAALAESLGLDPRRFWQDYNPNQHVYNLTLDAFENMPTHPDHN